MQPMSIGRCDYFWILTILLMSERRTILMPSIETKQPTFLARAAADLESR